MNRLPAVAEDAHDAALLARVRPAGRPNPAPAPRYNLVVVGGGTAGLVCAAGAAGLGAKVALVERDRLGGDCLNAGCVPSKGLIAAARAAAQVRNAGAFGIRLAGEPQPDFGAAMARMRRLRAEIAANDSVERFERLGVDVFLSEGRFISPDTVEVDGRRLRFSSAVVATGARAVVPTIPGLAEVDPYTNETLFTLTELPRRVVVIGAGPIGCEMAQSLRRFGSEVCVVEMESRIMPREDPDAAAVVLARLKAEGVRPCLGARLKRVERRNGETAVIFDQDGAERVEICDAVLVGAGRAPNVEGLGLEAAGVAYGTSGVEVDDRLRTSNPRIYAAGDVCSKYKFTHAADAMARVVLRNALFLGRARVSGLAIPWCTYTDPEVAHVGLTAAEAARAGARVRTITQPFAEVDRSILEGETEGFLRLYTDARSGRVLGATVAGAHAGEMIGALVLAVRKRLSAADLSATIHPYPTRAEAIRKAGDAWMRTRLTPLVRRLLGAWLRWRRS